MRSQSQIKGGLRAAVAMIGALLALAGPFMPVSGPARAAEHETAGEAPAQMDEPTVRHLLGEFGYSDISNLKRDGDTWKATARKGGADRTVEVHARSGLVTELK
jgi:hypothetical protein